MWREARPSALGEALQRTKIRARSTIGLDGLGDFHDLAVDFIDSQPPAASAFERMLGLFQLGRQITMVRNPELILPQWFRSPDQLHRLERRVGSAALYRISNAIRADNAVIGPWMMSNAQATVTVAQSLHLIDEVNSGALPGDWHVLLPGLVDEPAAAIVLNGLRSNATDEELALAALKPCIGDLERHIADKNLKRKRGGAYAVLDTDIEDRATQAASSGFELLDRLSRDHIKDHPLYEPWRDTFSNGPEAADRLRFQAAIERLNDPGDWDTAAYLDVTLNDTIRAGMKLRYHLNRIKHADKGLDEEALHALRCLIALDAVLIVVAGVLQVRRDNPVFLDALEADIEPMESVANLVLSQFPEHIVDHMIA